jgi:uncharacterized SAM-dependent methyltransferase
VSSLVIHPALNEQTLEQERILCLKQGRVNPKFHYETRRQSELWLKVHEQFAPPEDVSGLYKGTGQYLSQLIKPDHLTLVGLGCGGGEKDISILRELPDGVNFIPTDVSIPLVQAVAQRANRDGLCTGVALAFDIFSTENVLNFMGSHLSRHNIFTSFGLIPNFGPQEIFPKLYSLLKSEDYLLLSANLAPEGIDKVLWQYDNQPTKDWLAQFLHRFGQANGRVTITTERSQQLDFISARFIFSSTSILRSGVNEFVFEPDDQIDLFTSYRYTEDSLKTTLSEHRIDVVKAFISQNGEEGVFICQLQ